MKNVIIVILVAGIGVFAWFYFSGSEESEIRKRFDQLSEWSSRDVGENKIMTAKKINNIKSIFADRVRIKAPGKSSSKTYGKQDIARIALAILSQYSRVSTRFSGLGINLSGETARAAASASLAGELPSGEEIENVHELECELEKIGGEWLFTAIEVIDDLEE